MVMSSPMPTLMCSALVVALQEEQSRGGEVVHVQELPPRRARSPQRDRPARAFASWNLRIIAGSTWRLLRSKLSPGPYRLVGIAEIHEQPYCRRIACTCRIPAIFAMA